MWLVFQGLMMLSSWYDGGGVGGPLKGRAWDKGLRSQRKQLWEGIDAVLLPCLWQIVTSLLYILSP